MKIDPYNYPVIIITAFVIGMILAMVFGFRPQHGSSGADVQGCRPPTLVQTVEAWETINL